MEYCLLCSLVSWGQWAMGPYRSHLIIDSSSSSSQLCEIEQASLNLDVLIPCQMGMRRVVRIKGDNVYKSDNCTALGLYLPERPWFGWVRRLCVHSSYLLQSPHSPPWPTAKSSVGQPYCTRPNQIVRWAPTKVLLTCLVMATSYQHQLCVTFRNVLTHFILTATLQDGRCPHFEDEQKEVC